MKRTLAIAACGLLLMAAPALAGVVITQETVSESPRGTTHEHHTIFIQGNKQKTVMNGRITLLDLDAGSMTVMNTGDKTYVKLPFPPQGRMAAMMHRMGALNPNLKKTGKSKTMAGYHCEVYSGIGKNHFAEYHVSGCFATGAPGAAEYNHFIKAVEAKFKADSLPMAERPDGVPLQTVTTTKLVSFAMPGMTPEQQKKMKEEIAKGKMTSKTSTTTVSVKSEELPANTFAIPAGYKEAQMSQPPMAAPGKGHYKGE